MTKKTTEIDSDRDRIRRVTHYFYDIQKLRIAMGNRTADPADYKIVTDVKTGKDKKVKKKKGKATQAQVDRALEEVVNSLRHGRDEPPEPTDERKAPLVLEEADRDYLKRHNHVLEGLELDTLQRVKELIVDHPIFPWLEKQKGCGPTLSAVLISEIDITKCDTVSALWAYCGLAVDTETGFAVRRQKGKKSNWNPFLKSKCFLLSERLVMANKGQGYWKLNFYNTYKHRKQNTMVDTCMLCNGVGKIAPEKEKKGKNGAAESTSGNGADKKLVTCYNCGGTGGPCSWGRSNAHRDLAAKRRMVKAFLQALWIEWRTLEGLPVTEPYAEAKLGMKHGDHAAIAG